jgi:hypothetical protein
VLNNLIIFRRAHKANSILVHYKEIHLTFLAALGSYDQLALKSKGLTVG